MMYLQEAEVKLKRKYTSVDTLKRFSGSQDAVHYARTAFYNDCEDHKEHMMVVLLSRSNRVIGHRIISTGSSTGTICDIKDILLTALNLKAEGIILYHNHPSGNLQPSFQDQEITKKLKGACMFMDIALQDHIIISCDPNQYYSFADEGII